MALFRLAPGCLVVCWCAIASFADRCNSFFFLEDQANGCCIDDPVLAVGRIRCRSDVDYLAK